MAVANSTVIQKMMNEIQQASRKQTNHKEMVKHIANVKLLCDLLIEEDASPAVQDNDITEAEMKAMIGDGNSSTIVKKQSDHSTIDHDEANGKSIFDF